LPSLKDKAHPSRNRKLNQKKLIDQSECTISQWTRVFDSVYLCDRGQAFVLNLASTRYLLKYQFWACENQFPIPQNVYQSIRIV